MAFLASGPGGGDSGMREAPMSSPTMRLQKQGSGAAACLPSQQHVLPSQQQHDQHTAAQLYEHYSLQFQPLQPMSQPPQQHLSMYAQQQEKQAAQAVMTSSYHGVTWYGVPNAQVHPAAV